MVVSFANCSDAVLFEAILKMYGTSKEWISYQDLQIKKSVIDRATRLGYVYSYPRVDKRLYAARLSEKGKSFARLIEYMGITTDGKKEETKEEQATNRGTEATQEGSLPAS